MRVFVLLLLLKVCAFSNANEIPYVNWENHPVRALAISPDKKHLAVVHTAENRVYVYNIELGYPVKRLNVQVGLDPVAVQFLSNTEVWVVNHISDSVSVVDVSAGMVKQTLHTCDEPSDLAFANSKAFVSCSQDNDIAVFQTQDLNQEPEIIELFAEEPKSMTVSADGAKLYVALFESGNKTTILGGGIDESDGTLGFPNNPVNRSASPYLGENPPPNTSDGFDPEFNDELPVPPKVSMIVKQSPEGEWFDDNGGDWTHMISGSESHLSGRVPGWTLLDRDIAVIDTQTHDVSYIGGLMNIGMSLSVNSAKQELTLVGTDATNEVRFEPLLNGKFLRVNLAKVNMNSLESEVIDLNSHLDYQSHSVDLQTRELSIGDPRSIVWRADGERGFVSGMGSNNVIVIDSNGTRQATIEVGEGVTGLAMDESRSRLYAWNHFEASLSMIDLQSQSELHRFQLFNPLPDSIKNGRKFLYGTHETSGTGHVSCASCHVDSRMDRLAWDLGDPSGEMKIFNQNCQTEIASLTDFECSDFHPMKGPMMTQTLQDIIGHEPFHWRGDRDGLEEFNGAFTGLLGADEQLNEEDMQSFEDMLSTITFPPNPFRNKDNSLPQSVDLSQQYTSGRFAPAGQPLGSGDPQRGLQMYNLNLLDGVFQCGSCHTLPTGMAVNGPLMLGTIGAEVGGSIMPLGPMGENHLGIVSVDGSTQKAFKTPHLRNVYEKVGFETSRQESLSGFGFLHDGAVDSVSRFLSAPAFSVNSDQDVADLVALMMAFSGSELDNGFIPLGNDVPLSQDSHAGAGQQFTLGFATQSSDSAEQLISIAESERVNLVVRSPSDNFYYDTAEQRFVSSSESFNLIELMSQASASNPMTFTIVPQELTQRLARDRDMDGIFDETEISQGSDPTNSESTQLRPRTGLWYNPQRSGHGFDVQIKGNNMFVVWYTYNQDGSPHWYLAVGPRSENWTGDLNQHRWNHDTREVEVETVGQLNVLFSDSKTAEIQWQIGEQSGSESIQYFKFSSDPTVHNYSGTYFDPMDIGWGMSLDTQGGSQVAVIYYYDQSGAPRWVLGNGKSSAVNSFAMSSFTGFCPGCEWFQVQGEVVGDLQLQAADDWYRNRSFDLLLDLTYPQDSSSWVIDSENFTALSDEFFDPVLQ